MNQPTPNTRIAQNPRVRRSLLGLNALLACVLALLWLAPPGGSPRAVAQTSDEERARGRYTLVGGRLPAGNADAVWILDSVNQEIIGVRWDSSRGRLDGLGYRNLNDDLGVREGR
ncbi:MAG: hypothetical protein AAGB51_05120 [Planctomycetota bacterium]